MSEPTLYYYIKGTHKVGPFTLIELRQKKLSSDTLVFKTDQTDWLPLRSYPELFNYGPSLPLEVQLQIIRRSSINKNLFYAALILLSITFIGFTVGFVINNYDTAENERQITSDFNEAVAQLVGKSIQYSYSCFSSAHGFVPQFQPSQIDAITHMRFAGMNHANLSFVQRGKYPTITLFIHKENSFYRIRCSFKEYIANVALNNPKWSWGRQNSISECTVENYCKKVFSIARQNVFLNPNPHRLINTVSQLEWLVFADADSDSYSMHTEQISSFDKHFLNTLLSEIPLEHDMAQWSSPVSTRKPHFMHGTFYSQDVDVEAKCSITIEKCTLGIYPKHMAYLAKPYTNWLLTGAGIGAFIGFIAALYFMHRKSLLV